MDIAFVVDPLPSLKAYKDSSVAMMRALATRGHRVFALEQGDIVWDRGTVRARASPSSSVTTTTIGTVRARRRRAGSRSSGR